MRRLSVVILFMLVTSQTGCALVDPVQTFSRSVWTSFKPRGSDYTSPGDVVDTQWEAVGVEARGDRPLEPENDPFRNVLVSPRAQSIERNLGITN